MDLGHECSGFVSLYGDPRTAGTFIRTFIHFEVPTSRILQEQFAFFSEVASVLLHGVISLLRATGLTGTRFLVINRGMATLMTTQCCDLCFGDVDPDAPLVLEPCNEPGLGDVAVQSGDDAQQGFSFTSCAIRYESSALIFCHDVERPAIAFLEVHQSTHADKVAR